MKFLLDKLESAAPLFEKGGRFEKLYPIYEAVLTIHFSLRGGTKTGAHVRDSLDTKRYMILVVLALLPATLFGIYNAGYQSHLAAGLGMDLLPVVLTGLKIFLPILLVSYVVGGIWEVVFAVVRRHEINEGFLVTGLLFPLTLPPTIPLWQVALGISFGVVIGKEVFGGTGKNFLNPALSARAFVYFSYPAYMSGEVWTMLSVAKDKVVDGVSAATPLGVAAMAEAGASVTEALAGQGYSLSQVFLGLMPGSLGETSVLACLLGAALLIGTGVGSWRIMSGCVLGAVGMTFVFNFFAGDASPAFFGMNAIWQLCIGGFAFGAVFMATDPVSAPDLEVSKWVYGILIGAFTILIRVANPAYPEGIMLAILLMNVFASFIDYLFVNRRLKKRIPHNV